MNRFVVILLIFMAAFQVYSQQPLELLMEQRGEVVVSIDPSDISLIPQNASWSIEPMQSGRARVYLNKNQYQKLVDLNIPFLPERAPSMISEVTMASSPEAMATWDAYPDYETYLQMMQQLALDFPDICRLDTIGYSVNGRLLLALKISDNVAVDEAEPELFYSSSMHGDELTGYVLMLRLADYLLNNYNQEHIKNLVDNLEIYINPLANPDGTFKSGNTTVYGAIRYNANYVDLNRNFPDPKRGDHPDGNAWQPENIAMMDFMGKHHFNLSMNFHGGAELLNYPWDTFSQRHADNDWFVLLSREYADTVHVYDAYYMNDLNDGITNGYDWYEVAGGRQDYVTYFLHGREITAELSAVKTPDASTLPDYWNKSYRSLLNYLNQALYGVQGFVTDTLGNPLKAQISIASHDKDSSQVYSGTDGFYVRYLKAGTYTLTYSVSGYEPETRSLIINDSEKIDLNVFMANPLAIADKSISGIRVFPNPADTYLQLDGYLSPFNQLIIYDLLGKQVSSWNNVSSSGKIDISQLKSGIYFVEVVQSGSSVIIQRIVVE